MDLRRTLLALITMFALAACSRAAVKESSYRRNPSGGLEVSCIGPESAGSFVIYLHGIDSVNPSQQELENRAILNDIAKTRNIRFALPRAQMPCPSKPGSVCWGWKFDQTELSEILPLIIDSRSACFAAEKPFSILGFSNGGYLVTRWYSKGMLPMASPRPVSLVTSGSGKGDVSAGIDDLSKNPKLTLIIGKQDQFNFDPRESFYHQLQTLKAPVQLIEFQGSHVLDETALLESLRN